MADTRGCTQCGNCLITCPLFRATRREEYSPKAKQDLLELGAQGAMGLDWEKVVTLSGRCVSCERCLRACSRKLSVPEALSRARAKNPRWQQYFWREWVKRGAHLWPLAARLSSLAPKGVLPEGLRVMHNAAEAMNALPERPAWFALADDTPQTAQGVDVVFFGGCTAGRLRPAWVRKTESTLRAMGANLKPSTGFVCCGGTYEHAGMIDSALEAAKGNLDYWRSLGRPKVAVICASCMHSLAHYPALEGLMDKEEGEAWKKAITPLSTFLVGAKVTRTEHAPQRYAYHSPCHWGAKDPDMAWLKSALPGLAKGKTLCCGFGGVFKMMDPLLSKELAAQCWSGFAKIEGQKDLPVLTGCSGCTMQLNAHAPEGGAALHWLDVWQA